MYLLYGRFCQPNRSLALGFAAGEGAVALVQESVSVVEFYGRIFPSPHVDGALIGVMHDSVGIALLANVSVSATEVRFIKRYENARINGGLGISWALRKEDASGSWVGEYSVSSPANAPPMTGPIRCAIVEANIPEVLFEADARRYRKQAASFLSSMRGPKPDGLHV